MGPVDRRLRSPHVCTGSGRRDGAGRVNGSMAWLSRLLADGGSAAGAEPTPPEVDFIAIDVETASGSRHSICQFGAVGFRDGQEVFAYQTLMDPACDFSPFNIAIHGITPDHVRGAPTYHRSHDAIDRLLSGRVVVAHSNFDKGALGDACRENSLPPVVCRWLDTVAVARRTWPDLPNHKLKTLAAHFGHSFKHHDALEDARVAGLIMLRAMEKSSVGLDHWFAPERQRSRRVARHGGAEGPLAGQRVVLSGDFTAPKPMIADMIAGAGGAVAASVSKRTTLLVLGRPITPWAVKSNKQLAVEAFIAAGYRMAIITEAQLRERLA